MVSDRHQALFAQSETKNSNNPFSSLHFSRAVSHDMPSSAAALQVATVTKANLAGKIASRQRSLTFPWHEHNAQRHEGPQFQHTLPTVLKIHPITCTIFWPTSNLATFHQTVRVATLHTHWFQRSGLATKESILNTHTHAYFQIPSHPQVEAHTTETTTTTTTHSV